VIRLNARLNAQLLPSRGKARNTALPSTFEMEDRERFEEVKKAESVSTMIQESCRVLKEELQVCCFTTLRSSNSRMVQLYMSKQIDAKNMLTN